MKCYQVQFYIVKILLSWSHSFLFYFIIAFVLVNVLIGIIITMISRSKYPYKLKARNVISNFNSFRDKDIENVALNQNSDSIEDDQDRVNKLAQELIPNSEDQKNPKQKAVDEMEKKVKELFDSKPDEATKIFKTMLKNK